MPIFTYLSKATVSALTHVLPHLHLPYHLLTENLTSSHYGAEAQAFRYHLRCFWGLRRGRGAALSQPGRPALPTTPTLCPSLPTCSTL